LSLAVKSHNILKENFDHYLDQFPFCDQNDQIKNQRYKSATTKQIEIIQFFSKKRRKNLFAHGPKSND
jgi:hypothetical protein